MRVIIPKSIADFINTRQAKGETDFNMVSMLMGHTVGIVFVEEEQRYWVKDNFNIFLRAITYGFTTQEDEVLKIYNHKMNSHPATAEAIVEVLNILSIKVEGVN